MVDPASPQPLDRLLERAAELERELLEIERMLGVAGAGTPRPGAHLVVEAGGQHALLPAAAVAQIARLVEFTPIPGSPPAVLGGFVWRGRPAIALDLATVLAPGGPAAPPQGSLELDLDKHLVIVAGARALGVLVDRVQQVVDAPLRVDAATERDLPTLRSELIAGWCNVGGWILPLVSIPAMERLGFAQDHAREIRPRAGEGERT